MGRLENGTCVQVIETGRIGEVLSRETWAIRGCAPLCISTL